MSDTVRVMYCIWRGVCGEREKAQNPMSCVVVLYQINTQQNQTIPEILRRKNQFI